MIDDNKVHPYNTIQGSMKVRTALRAGKPLGDQVADLIHLTGLDNFSNLYTQITGKDCGCKQRQEWLNRLFPG